MRKFTVTVKIEEEKPAFARYAIQTALRMVIENAKQAVNYEGDTQNIWEDGEIIGWFKLHRKED